MRPYLNFPLLALLLLLPPLLSKLSLSLASGHPLSFFEILHLPHLSTANMQAFGP